MKYPKESVIIRHSLLSMAMGWLMLSLMSVILGFIVALIIRMPEWAIIPAVFVPLYSTLVVLGAWLLLFLPVYLFLYYNEKYFSKRWRFTMTGSLVGFFVPFGGMFLWGGIMDQFRLNSGDFSLLGFALLGGIAGGPQRRRDTD